MKILRKVGVNLYRRTPPVERHNLEEEGNINANANTYRTCSLRSQESKRCPRGRTPLQQECTLVGAKTGTM